jgi:hypothetical protein
LTRLFCAFLGLSSLLTLSARADSPAPNDLVSFVFTGTISACNEQFIPSTITPQTGDPFVLSLTFWRSDAPYNKSTVGFGPDNTHRGAYAEYLLINNTYYFGGQDFTSFDAHSALSLSDSLNFTATDQGYGVVGNASVSAAFPADWFADLRNPLPGNLSAVNFAALGHFDYFYGNTLPSVSGNITAGSVQLLTNSAAAFPASVPEPASLALFLPLALLSLRRRKPAPHHSSTTTS